MVGFDKRPLRKGCARLDTSVSFEPDEKLRLDAFGKRSKSTFSTELEH